MSDRKHSTKGQYRKTAEYKKEKKGRPDNELQRYLSIIDDLNGKLYNPAKYHATSDETSELLDSLRIVLSYDQASGCSEKADLWQRAGDPEWREGFDERQWHYIEDEIISSYRYWMEWVQSSEYSDKYLELVASLHPATINSLPKIVPEFKSPDQIRLNQELEQAYDPDMYSELQIDDFELFKEVEPEQYQILARDRKDYHLQMADLIQTHTPIIKTEKWPRGWMMKNKAIRENLTTKRHLVPILNYITDHALHRTEDVNTKKKIDRYIKDGKEYRYIATKINTEKIADSIGASKSTVKKYIQVLKNGDIIKPLAPFTRSWYAIGYWNNRNRVFFLKNTPEFRQFLAEFHL